MIVCLDTNVLVQARATGHPFFPIVNPWVAGRLTIAVSTGILLEYAEVIVRLSGREPWRKLSRLMDLVEMTTGSLLRVTPHYRFRIINDDPDDNLFTDCAITAEANYVITEDRHFAPLIEAGYKPKPMAPQEFMASYAEICNEGGLR